MQGVGGGGRRRRVCEEGANTHTHQQYTHISTETRTHIHTHPAPTHNRHHHNTSDITTTQQSDRDSQTQTNKTQTHTHTNTHTTRTTQHKKPSSLSLSSTPPSSFVTTYTPCLFMYSISSVHPAANSSGLIHRLSTLQVPFNCSWTSLSSGTGPAKGLPSPVRCSIEHLLFAQGTNFGGRIDAIVVLQKTGVSGCTVAKHRSS